MFLKIYNVRKYVKVWNTKSSMDPWCQVSSIYMQTFCKVSKISI